MFEGLGVDFLSLGLAYGTYFVGIMSPGPSNVFIMRKSLVYGRKGGVVTALGVMSGSLCWGILASFGFGVVLLSYSFLLDVVGVMSGCFFGWLGFCSFRAMVSGLGGEVMEGGGGDGINFWRLYFYGMGIHLVNPKVFFVWISIVTLGIPDGSVSFVHSLMMVVGCGVLGLSVCVSYAWIFSTEKMVGVYRRYGGWFYGVVGSVFVLASVGLLYRSATGFVDFFGL